MSFNINATFNLMFFVFMTLRVVPPGPMKCGVSPMTRVIGGVDAVPGNWPWQVKAESNLSLPPFFFFFNVASTRKQHSFVLFV